MGSEMCIRDSIHTCLWDYFMDYCCYFKINYIRSYAGIYIYVSSHNRTIGAPGSVRGVIDKVGLRSRRWSIVFFRLARPRRGTISFGLARPHRIGTGTGSTVPPPDNTLCVTGRDVLPLEGGLLTDGLRVRKLNKTVRACDRDLMMAANEVDRTAPGTLVIDSRQQHSVFTIISTECLARWPIP